MADRVFASNDNVGIYQDVNYFTFAINGNVTADAEVPVFPAPAAGTVVSFGLAEGETGADASNPLFMELDVLKNNTSIVTTKAKLDKTAADRATTFVAGTGVTAGVLKTDGTTHFAAGDYIALNFDITRTASPGTEIADVIGIIGVKFDSVPPTS